MTEVLVRSPIDRDSPYRRDHDQSVERGMDRGKMPKSLDGLLHWYLGCVQAELPDRLHRQELWHDDVTEHERSEGIRPQGGSALGTLAWTGPMKALLERSASQIDEDGSYRFPTQRAIEQVSRRWPYMARCLRALAMNGGDWRALAAAWDFQPEVMEVFATEALRRLWMGWYDRTTKGMT